MDDFGYRKLIVYQKAKDLVINNYRIIKNFPKEEQYALCDQIRRASVSVTSNIAEGLSRFSVKEKSHFLQMAHGSLMELSSQFEIAEGIGYIPNDVKSSLDCNIAEIGRMINGLIKSFNPQQSPIH